MAYCMYNTRAAHGVLYAIYSTVCSVHGELYAIYVLCMVYCTIYVLRMVYCMQYMCCAMHGVLYKIFAAHCMENNLSKKLVRKFTYKSTLQHNLLYCQANAKLCTVNAYS
jgi:hypothetical protein